MPRYMLTIVGDDDAYQALGPDEAKQLHAGHEAFAAALVEAGVSIEAGAELEPPATARTLHADGQVTDGPFAEAKEQLGGFYIIDVADQDTAVAWARKIPLLPNDKIEVRQAK